MSSNQKDATDSSGLPSSVDGPASITENKLSSQHESKEISQLRVIVMTVLVISTTAVALCVYFFTRNAEAVQFSDAVTTDADKVINSIAEGFTQMMSATDGLSVHVLSYAAMNNMTWPFVTVENFAVQAAKARKMSPTLYYKIHPFVSANNRDRYEQYMSTHTDQWVQEALDAQRSDPSYKGRIPGLTADDITTNDVIWGYKSTAPKKARPYSAKGHIPDWQASPLTTDNWPFGWDFYDNVDHTQVDMAFQTKQIILSKAYNLHDPNIEAEVQETKNRAGYYSTFLDPADDASEPLCEAMYPLIDSAYEMVQVDTSQASNVIGLLVTAFYWGSTLKNVLLPGKDGMIVVFDNPCNPSFTYEVNGPEATYLGRGDFHNSDYDSFETTARLGDVAVFQEFLQTYTGITLNQDFCPHTIRIYPSSKTESIYTTNQPLYFMLIAAVVFASSTGIFLFYDWLVQRRQARLLHKAKQSHAIVSSLFPSSIQDRLYGADGAHDEVIPLEAPNKKKLRSFLNGKGSDDGLEDDDNVVIYKTKPIADLFTDTTIMYGDICGFTSWSSAREPSQVFMLLETIYKAFDEIAKQRRVFKVETVGDSYVAVCGLPDPTPNHAVTMARFAKDCLRRLRVLVQKLEEVLGPDTADLSMRFGLHSGPVTAGVLRGERSRFQLFGDTMNTAARIESTGSRGRIHVSSETAALLRKAGKSSWLTEREDKVFAKGKGLLTTFWLSPRGDDTRTTSEAGSESGSGDYQDDCMANKEGRLIKWVCDELSNQLKLIKAKNVEQGKANKAAETMRSTLPDIKRADCVTVLEEVQEIIHLPHFESDLTVEIEEVELGTRVEEQLTAYVTAIAAMYRNNPFHNFEHASHVTLSVLKLLGRIVAPDLNEAMCKAGEIASKLHDHTYGITSDPLTQFACAFSALIHDVDHTGVPNGQVMKENPALGELYKNRSVAEQNSIDLSWKLLASEDFSDLRYAIFGNDKETQARFRHLVVNAVMATDIMDKELKVLRNNRWDNAFKSKMSDEDPKDVIDRKATIVIEHLIQASDVSHTMQHWHIYTKWNQRLFSEMTKAYEEGRSDTDPAENWYKGEIGFFDFYIIPLAKKLKDCGVFGVSSDEYLNYALTNRAEWEARGQEIVASYVENLNSKRGE